MSLTGDPTGSIAKWESFAETSDGRRQGNEGDIVDKGKGGLHTCLLQ